MLTKSGEITVEFSFISFGQDKCAMRHELYHHHIICLFIFCHSGHIPTETKKRDNVGHLCTLFGGLLPCSSVILLRTFNVIWMPAGGSRKLESWLCGWREWWVNWATDWCFDDGREPVCLLSSYGGFWRFACWRACSLPSVFYASSWWIVYCSIHRSASDSTAPLLIQSSGPCHRSCLWFSTILNETRVLTHARWSGKHTLHSSSGLKSRVPSLFGDPQFVSTSARLTRKGGKDSGPGLK